ncbi:DUF2785 domain-containing protein [Cytobacillus solani]|uniref:DUF2785 domain-containing protein n=1 Tax=Cytobacillus solani TaxID=1637975 RepID=UPI002079450F|nr:DUF2785 domain-containing protein [Cytobacillus solani]USK52866.1 DUF2785 domain-containing protein [Cytobacillus solani]
MHNTKTKLMKDLIRIQKEHYQLQEGEEVQDFVTQMLQYIGDPQPELRDDLIYTTFQKWIFEMNKFTDEELRNLLSILIDKQHLLYHLGNAGDLTVLTRAFSVLPIALILHRHLKQPFLAFSDFQAVKNALLRFYKEEKDLRGYLPVEGWAHSAAHGADALEELIQCPESDMSLQLEVLDVIKGMLHNGIYIFCDEEDERIASIVDTMIVKNLIPNEKITDWLISLADCADWTRNRDQMIAQINSKNFIRSLYFRREYVSHNNQLAAALLEAEGKLNNFATH